MKKYLKVLVAFMLTFQVMSISSVLAADSLDDITIDASRYNQYKEQLEKELNGDNLIDRTATADYTFQTYGRVHVDGWNTKIISAKLGEDGYHEIRFVADEGYKLPEVKKNSRFVLVTPGNGIYTIDGEQGVLRFQSGANSDVYNAVTILARCVAIPNDVVENEYLKTHAFFTVQHCAREFTLEDKNAGISFLIDGARTYLVEKGKDLKVYYSQQKNFKPIESVSSKTGVSDNPSLTDYRNRYRVFENIRGDSLDNQMAYDATMFTVQVYSYTKATWVTLSHHDFYHEDNEIKMPPIDNEDILYSGMRVIGYKIQTTQYQPTMTNAYSFDEKDVGLDYVIQTKASDYNVQWTSTGVDGGYNASRVSSLRHRIGTIFLTPLYQYEYNVDFVDYDGTLLDTQKVLAGQAALEPETPSRESVETRDADGNLMSTTSYTFREWDKDYTYIIEDTVVTALYDEEIIPAQYIVVFVDHDGTVLDEQSVTYGKDAAIPTTPVREGYEFREWDTDFTNIKTDITVTALYDEIIEEEPVLPPVEEDDVLGDNEDPEISVVEVPEEDEVLGDKEEPKQEDEVLGDAEKPDTSDTNVIELLTMSLLVGATGFVFLKKRKES